KTRTPATADLAGFDLKNALFDREWEVLLRIGESSVAEIAGVRSVRDPSCSRPPRGNAQRTVEFFREGDLERIQVERGRRQSRRRGGRGNFERSDAAGVSRKSFQSFADVERKSPGAAAIRRGGIPKADDHIVTAGRDVGRCGDRLAVFDAA